MTKETADLIRGVGIMTRLDGGELPIELELSRSANAIRYMVRVGADCGHWFTLTESKRWNAVYLFAAEDQDAAWTWSEPVSGSVAGAWTS